MNSKEAFYIAKPDPCLYPHDAHISPEDALLVLQYNDIPAHVLESPQGSYIATTETGMALLLHAYGIYPNELL